MYIKILILGAAILIMFRTFTRLNKVLPLSNRFKHTTSYLLPVIELLSWIGFAIWCIHFVYEAEAYDIIIVLGIIILLIFTPTWFLARDFLYGMILKFQKKIEIDSKIETADFKGIITRTDYFTFDVKTYDGNIKTIPYNKVGSEVLIKNAANQNLIKQKILFTLPASSNTDKLVYSLKKTLVNSPWVAASAEPIINNIYVDEEKTKVEVLIHLLTEKHQSNVKNWVQKNFKME